MEPISVAASIVGLLIAASEISGSFNAFIRKVKHAPKVAHAVLREVSEIQSCCMQIERYFSNKAHLGSHAVLLTLEDVGIVLSDCVSLISELERLIGPLTSIRYMQAGQKARWTFKDREIRLLLGRCKSSQASLRFMLTTMSW